MIEIPFPNAFTINRLGFNASLFPLFPFSIQYHQQDEVSSLFVCPQRVVDICDLLETYALEMITIFDVGPSYDLTLGELADEAKIEHSSIDESTVVLSIRDLSRLLSDFYHYDFYMFDIDPNWDELGIIGQVITCREYDWRSRVPLLSSLSRSRLFLYCHDDCYLTLESKNSLFLKRVFARTLQIYTGTVLWNEKLQLPLAISAITAGIMDDFWQDELGLTILSGMTTYDNGRLRIGVSKRAYNFGESVEYPTEFWMEYDVANQVWTLAN